MAASKTSKTLGFIFLSIFLVFLALILLTNKEVRQLTETTREDLPGEFINLPMGTTHYELGGPTDGDLVVLVHGFSVPYYVWDPTFEALTGSGYHVLRYDLYGRGFSDRPDTDYDLDLYLGQLENLLDELNLNRKTHLIGLSMGGPIVAAYANRHPKAVRSVTLIAPEVLTVKNAEIFPMNFPVLGELVSNAYLVPFYLPSSQKTDFYNPGLFPDWDDHYREQMVFKGFRKAILSSIRNLAGQDSLAEYKKLGEIQIPVLLVWGEEDRSVSFEAVQSALEQMPQAELHVVPETAHLPHYEQAQEVSPIILEFLAAK